MTEIDQAKLSEEAREIAQEQSKQGTFNFVDRLASRNYPTDDVEIFLDERAGHKIQKLTEDLMGTKDPEQREVIEKQIEHASEEARASRYIVHLQGISTEEYDAVVDFANEKYPLEYTEQLNPLTRDIVRQVVPNEDRDLLYRTQLWAKFFQSIEDAEGNVDDKMTPEFISYFLRLAPVIAQIRVGIAIERLRMTTDWMDQIQGEDFLAKS